MGLIGCKILGDGVWPMIETRGMVGQPRISVLVAGGHGEHRVMVEMGVGGKRLNWMGVVVQNSAAEIGGCVMRSELGSCELCAGTDGVGSTGLDQL